MAVKTVKLLLNGQTYDLTYDSSSGTWKASINAPATTSWNENSDHTYHGTVTATDDANNTTTETYTKFSDLALRVLEKVKPTIAVTYPTAGAYITSAKPTIAWTVADDGSGIDSSTIGLRIDGGANVSADIVKTATANGYSCTYTPSTALAEGAHTLAFFVSDNDGNTSDTVSVAFTVDTVPPVLNITSPTNGLITNSSSLLVSGTTNDATSSPVSVAIKLNGVDQGTVTVGTDGSWSKTITLSEGENTLVVTATDAAGKTTTVNRTVTMDTGAPVITTVTLTPNPVDAGATFIIEVTVED